MNSIFEISTPFGWSFYVPAYALFSNIGLFLMMMFLYFRINRLSILFGDFLLEMIFMSIGVGIGSKTLFILTKIPDMVKYPSLKYVIETIITSGFVFYGGLFGAMLGTILFAKYKSIDIYMLMNIIIPGFPLFHMWGRIGCFFAGCCYGKPSSWGFSLEAEPNVLRIPIQLIESFFLFIIFIVLLFLEKRKTKVSLTDVYLFMYAMTRFFLEFFRGDSIRGMWFSLSTSQWISIAIIIILLAKTFHKNKKFVFLNQYSD